MWTNGHHQAHLALPMKAKSHRQLLPAQPIGTSSRCGKELAPKCKGVSITGVEKMRVLLPIPLQASAGKSTAKWTAKASTGGGQLGIDAQQRRSLKRGKRLPCHLSP